MKQFLQQKEEKKTKQTNLSCVIIVCLSQQLSVLTWDWRSYIHILFCFVIPESSSDKSSTTYLSKSCGSGNYEV